MIYAYIILQSQAPATGATSEVCRARGWGRQAQRGSNSATVGLSILTLTVVIFWTLEGSPQNSDNKAR